MSNSPELFAAELQAANDLTDTYNNCSEYTKLCDIAKQALEAQLAITGQFTDEQLDANDLPDNAINACKAYAEVYSLAVGTLACHVGEMLPYHLARALSNLDNLPELFRYTQLHQTVQDIQTDSAKEVAS